MKGKAVIGQFGTIFMIARSTTVGNSAQIEVRFLQVVVVTRYPTGLCIAVRILITVSVAG